MDMSNVRDWRALWSSLRRFAEKGLVQVGRGSMADAYPRPRFATSEDEMDVRAVQDEAPGIDLDSSAQG
jgi:hypothetical protein